jgi:hypothetical protein
MTSETELPETPETEEPTVGPVNHGRRKLGAAGMGGTAILLSVASRSAMGGWGQCTGSELASGNLSRTGTANPCGCSPGYWWNMNGYETWDKYITAYPRGSATFNQVFGVAYFAPDVLLTACGPSTDNPRALFPNDSGLQNVAMHAVAALFNASFYGSRYPVTGLQTPSAVIAAFQAASVSPAALKAFVARVDIYASANTWCNGKPHDPV